jgi:hypothetical protein
LGSAERDESGEIGEALVATEPWRAAAQIGPIRPISERNLRAQDARLSLASSDSVGNRTARISDPKVGTGLGPILNEEIEGRHEFHR